MQAEMISKRIITPAVQILELQDKLSKTDYKIIKCYEYSLAGLDLPYDIEALHTERQSIRDQINILETSL